MSMMSDKSQLPKMMFLALMTSMMLWATGAIESMRFMVFVILVERLSALLSTIISVRYGFPAIWRWLAIIVLVLSHSFWTLGHDASEAYFTFYLQLLIIGPVVIGAWGG